MMTKTVASVTITVVVRMFLGNVSNTPTTTVQGGFRRPGREYTLIDGFYYS